MHEPELLLELRNDQVSFRLYADASGEFRDIKSDATWRMGRIATQAYGPMYDASHAIFYRVTRAYAEEYPGRFYGRREGDRVRFTLLGRLGVERGCFVCSYRLDGPWLEVRIEEIDEQLPCLVYPTPLECERMVVPTYGIGRLYRTPLQSREFHDAFGNLSMRWFGGLRDDDAGWIGIFSEGYADAGVHLLGLAACPAWVKSRGAWRGDRAVRYRMTQGGYVGMAKTYRRWAMDHGLHRTLRDKIREIPHAQNLIGGRLLSMCESRTIHLSCYEDFGLPIPRDMTEKDGRLEVFLTHRQAAQIVREAQGLGMSRGIANVRGWIRGGYDESHPDIWPPEPALGSPDELKALMTHGPVMGALHDNYQDIYAQCPSFPAGVMRLPSGELAFGGLWWGGQAYLLCSGQALAHVRKNWTRIQAQLRPSAMFIDTVTASPLYECWDDAHPMRRADDETHKLEMLRLLRADGIVIGSEETRDFAVSAIDWFEARHVHSAGESIPLWPLVYHDAAICARYTHPTGPDGSGKGAPNWLADMLWGYILHWGVRHAEEWQLMKEDFRNTLHVDRWHARVGLDEMTGHRFVTDDGLVEKTEFSSGLAIAANFAGESRVIDGRVVPAGGYAIFE